MKVTKEMVQRIRATFPSDSMAAMIAVDRRELEALLDERKELRAISADILDWVESMPDESLRSDALRDILALGEDEL